MSWMDKSKYDDICIILNPRLFKYKHFRSDNAFNFMIRNNRTFRIVREYINELTEEQQMRCIIKDPLTLLEIRNPSYEIQKQAIKRNGLLIRNIDDQTEELCYMAIESQQRSVVYIKNLTYDMLIRAISLDPYHVLYTNRTPRIIELMKQYKINI